MGSNLLLALSQLSCLEPRAALRAQAGRAAGEVDYASDQAKTDEIRAFYKRLFGRDEYSLAWSEMEKYRSGSGLPERKPYVDSWYPYSSGGTDAYGALSLYDKAFHQGTPRAASWEATNHGSAGEPWWGHCDANAAMTIRFKNPRLSVARPRGCDPRSRASCTVFQPSDIRALLAEINKNALAKFLAGGEPCDKTAEELASQPFPRSRPQVMDNCEDANPASFHAALTNFLGRMKQPLIFDISADAEIWNYPVYSYSSVPRGPLTTAEALRAMGLSGSSWIFNPKAASFYQLTTTVYYRASRNDLTGAGTIPEALNEKTYSYILELDRQGQVIGGEWIGASRLDHPDFVWMPFEPTDPTGSTKLGNPFVSNDEVIKLWAESVGENPLPYLNREAHDPFGVLFHPRTQEEWGRVNGSYRISLDGRWTGASFLGKQTVMRIETEGMLQESSQAQVEVKVNGKALRQVPLERGTAEMQFDARPGINVISLRWINAQLSTSVLDREFRFYAM